MTAEPVPPEPAAPGPSESVRPPLGEGFPRHPFLIVDGDRQLALTRPLVRIGRSRESDVVVDDRRVSRQHAELRWQPATLRFLLVDLRSTGGTQLNGYPIAQCPLEAGDTISLGGVEIIYGEEIAFGPGDGGLEGTTDDVEA